MAEIRRMRHTPLTRAPQLHNRTLSGNIFDQSLGLLQGMGGVSVGEEEEDSEHAHLQIIGEEVSISEGGGAAELLDSEHAHLQIIGKEVSISQEESKVVSVESVSDDEGTLGMGAGQREAGGRVVAEEEEEEEDDGGCGILEKLPCSDDTPGIGMEVCVGGGADLDMSDTPPISDHELDAITTTTATTTVAATPPPPATATTSLLIPAHHNGFVKNGPTDKLTARGASPSLEKTLEDGILQTAAASSDLQLRILQLLEESRYDLRYPVQRYSSHVTDISRQKGQGSAAAEAEVETAVVGGAAAGAPVTVPHSQVNGILESSRLETTSNSLSMSDASSTRKRGRPRKRPLTKEAATGTPTPPPPSGRKRGRPRKSPAAISSAAHRRKGDEEA